MPLIEWDDQWSVMDETIDQHHKILVDLLNRAYDDFSNDAQPEALAVVIHDLLNYATYHFYTEERLMAGNAYPDLKEHREEHARFILKVVELQKEFRNGNQNLFSETISFLKDWITHHICEDDARYGRFAADKS